MSKVVQYEIKGDNDMKYIREFEKLGLLDVLGFLTLEEDNRKLATLLVHRTDAEARQRVFQTITPNRKPR